MLRNPDRILSERRSNAVGTLIGSRRNTHHTQSGLNYAEFMGALARKMPARKYFEIGVSEGGSLRQIEAATVAIDPRFRMEKNSMGSKPALHLFQMTSDKFFQTYDLHAFLPGGFDLAFLDGMHQFEFLLRDFMNAEAKSHPKSIILLHDCLPVNAEMTERVRHSTQRVDTELKGWWTGDVWRMVPILRSMRPDLDVVFLNCYPTGLALVRGLDASSDVLRNNYDQIVDRYQAMILNDDSLVEFLAGITIHDAKEFLGSFKW